MVKHKIDGALNQNTNSNQNFKTNQIRTQKKKSKTDPFEPRWEEDMQWCFLNALEQTQCQRRKEKRKVKIEDRAPDEVLKKKMRRKEKRKVKIRGQSSKRSAIDKRKKEK